MFIPYRVIQIKNKHCKIQTDFPKKQLISIHQASSTRQPQRVPVTSCRINKNCCIFQENFTEGYEELNSNPHQQQQKSTQKQNTRLSLNIPNPEKETSGFFSIDLTATSDKIPQNTQKKPKRRPYSCIQTHRTLSKRYSSVSAQNRKQNKNTKESYKTKKASLATQKTTRKFMDSSCPGWKGVYNIYENQGKQYFFNFSQNIEGNEENHKKTKRRNLSAFSYQQKKMNEVKNCNRGKCAQDQLRKGQNQIQNYAQEARIKRSSQKLTLNEDTDSPQKTRLKSSRGNIITDENQARLINLQEVYQQWKGHFNRKKLKATNKNNSMGKKHKNAQELLAEGKIDGWQTVKYNKDCIQEENLNYFESFA